MKKNETKIKANFIVPLILATLVFSGTCVIVLHQLHHNHIDEEVRKSVSEVGQLFQMELQEDADMLRGLIGFLQKDEDIQDAWLANDRQSLIRYASPVFEGMRSEQNITHFYFHGLDSVNFLRVHNPEKHSDHIDRFTMKQAADSGRTAWGIELGPLGTFTLRVVYPWRIDGKLAGYIELGEEVAHITPELAEITDTDILVIINKTYLNRPGWEQGLEVFGQRGDWDTYPNFVVSDKSTKRMLPEVHEFLGGLSECQSEGHLSSVLYVSLDRQNYRMSFIPLIDAGGQDVGDIIVLKDITSQRAELKKLLIYMIGVCAAVSTLLVVFFCVYIARIERRIKDAYKGLLSEMEEHKRTRKKVQEQNEFLSDVLESLKYPFYVIDANDYTVKHANSSAKLGELPENVTCHMLSHHSEKPCEGADDPCPLKMVKKSKKAAKVDHVHYDNDGNKSIVEIHAYPILDDKGDVAQIIEYSLDITERREHEDKIQKTMKELDRFSQLSVGRELRMIELKKQVNELLVKLGNEPQYNIVLEDTEVAVSSETME